MQAAGGAAQVPGVAAQVVELALPEDHGSAAIPGTGTPGGGSAARPAPTYGRHDPPPASLPGTAAQQAFISQVAPGAMAAQHRYGIPASVTIAQAIDESGWGQSELATADHNLFGIKGTGPAGRDPQPTQEYENGSWVTGTAPFRVYHNIAESIADHGQLLATNPAYQHAMANRQVPDAFADALTGVYATDPDYGPNLIALMRLYNLYRYDSATATAAPASAARTPQVPVQPAVTTLAAVPGVSAHGTSGAPVGTGVPVGAGITGGVSIPGVAGAVAAGTVRARGARRSTPEARPMPTARSRPEAGQRPGPRIASRGSWTGARRYVPQIPQAVTADFVAKAKAPLVRAQPLYQDVAGRNGIRWELLAACDWMQCQAHPRYSPVHGEKLGTANPDGTVFRTRSAALAQCASELIELAGVVYLIDLTAARRPLSVSELARVFAAFRWGGLLRVYGISAMEFPYSVAGLTAYHLKMRWPDINAPHPPDKPGTRFRMPFGAVPVVLSLGYRAVAE